MQLFYALLMVVCVKADSILTESDSVVSVKHYVERYGYLFDETLLTTDDGYQVSLQRISTCTGASKKGPPILMMHGWEGSSADFLLNWPEKAPALMLVEFGYDVWLGNSRGNAYSKGHQNFNYEEDPSSYWDFGIEEMGSSDLPTFINEVLRVNGAKKLDYIGYELGNTQFFMAASLTPDYFDEKVNLFISFAPFVQNHRTINWWELMNGSIFNLLRTWSQQLGNYDYEQEQNQRLQKAMDCENALQWCIFWEQYNINFQLNSIERLAMFYGHTNMGTSYRVYNHIYQIAYAKKF